MTGRTAGHRKARPQLWQVVQEQTGAKGTLGGVEDRKAGYGFSLVEGNDLTSDISMERSKFDMEESIPDWTKPFFR